jgi:hypothetical protein
MSAMSGSCVYWGGVGEARRQCRVTSGVPSVQLQPAVPQLAVRPSYQLTAAGDTRTASGAAIR